MKQRDVGMSIELLREIVGLARNSGWDESKIEVLLDQIEYASIGGSFSDLSKDLIVGKPIHRQIAGLMRCCGFSRSTSGEVEKLFHSEWLKSKNMPVDGGEKLR